MVLDGQMHLVVITIIHMKKQRGYVIFPSRTANK